jgi:hypothetical protein
VGLSDGSNVGIVLPLGLTDNATVGILDGTAELGNVEGACVGVWEGSSLGLSLISDGDEDIVLGDVDGSSIGVALGTGNG